MTTVRQAYIFEESRSSFEKIRKFLFSGTFQVTFQLALAHFEKLPFSSDCYAIMIQETEMRSLPVEHREKAAFESTREVVVV